MRDVTQADLIRTLPYARRFARALVGSQSAGDALVAEALRRGLPDLPPRLALYAGVARLAAAPGAGGSGQVQALHAAGQAGAAMTPTQRQLLLLTSLEDLPVAEAALALGLTAEAAAASLAEAREALRAARATDILVIEDEPIIAMDLRRLVEACGHRVVGVAASEKEAIRLSHEQQPGLILADVNLGRGGDGISAVERIQKSSPVPVIFVTAYPERLLTAEQVEPAFVISKPFEPLALAIATYQATTAGSPLPV